MSEQDPRQDPQALNLPTQPPLTVEVAAVEPSSLQASGLQTAGQAGMTEVGRLELREERAFIEKRREQSGQVRVRREVERRTETLTVELLTETVVIEVLAGANGVFLDGQPLMEGETRQIVTYREEAEVQKKAVVSEEVRLLKRAVNTTQNFTVELGREVLRVEQAEATPGATSPKTMAPETSSAGSPGGEETV